MHSKPPLLGLTLCSRMHRAARRQQDVAGCPAMRWFTPSAAAVQCAGLSPTESKGAADLSRCCKDLPGAASSTHTEPTRRAGLSWAQMSYIYGQFRESKCSRTRTSQACLPYPHLSSGFLPRPCLTLQKDAHINSLMGYNLRNRIKLFV